MSKWHGLPARVCCPTKTWAGSPCHFEGTMLDAIVHSRIPILTDVDVLVVGAGSAGCCAAIAAAEAGAKTAIVDRYGFLGGTSTGVLDTFYGFYTPGDAPKRVIG